MLTKILTLGSPTNARASAHTILFTTIENNYKPTLGTNPLSTTLFQGWPDPLLSRVGNQPNDSQWPPSPAPANRTRERHLNPRQPSMDCQQARTCLEKKIKTVRCLCQELRLWEQETKQAGGTLWNKEVIICMEQGNHQETERTAPIFAGRTPRYSNSSVS